MAVAICCCRVKSSVTEAAKASELVFSIEIVSFPVGGMITRIAWGSTMRCITSRRSMPRAWAASVWPCSTEMIPARTISAIYAASFKPSPSVAAMNGVISVLVLTCHQIEVNGIPMPMCGRIRLRLNQKKICTSTGVPRKNHT